MASTIWGKMFRKLRDDPQGQDPHNNVPTYLIKKYQHYVINSISITRNKNVEYDNKNELLRKLARGEKQTNLLRFARQAAQILENLGEA